MTRNTIIPTLIFGGAFALGSSDIMAQTFGMEYTTEWQTDFKGGYDWLNLLKTTAEVPVHGAVTFEAATISTAKCTDNQLVDDLLTYSNIEAGNIPLTLARAGFALSLSSASFFVGINNVNEDYFTSEYTAFFTNSSCGISPTISCNYDIANYPLASWCVHYLQRLNDFTLQTSLYPGQGYSRLLGHDNLFSLNLNRDGIFSISSIDYRRNDINCILGVAVHYGVCMGDEDGEQGQAPAPEPKKRLSAAPWLLTEISLPYNFGLLAHASMSTVKNGCKDYACIGVIYDGPTVKPGISFGCASFTDATEYDIELSTRIPLTSDKFYVQPSLHLIGTDSRPIQCVGMLRLNLEI